MKAPKSRRKISPPTPKLPPPEFRQVAVDDGLVVAVDFGGVVWVHTCEGWRRIRNNYLAPS